MSEENKTTTPMPSAPTSTPSTVKSGPPVPVRDLTPEVKNPPTIPQGKMRIAKCLCTIDVGHTTPLADVTPAEALLLTAEFHKNAKGKPLTVLVETGLVDRTVTQEVQRLVGKYGSFKVSKLFAGAIPTLPSNFDEAIDVGIRTAAPHSKLGSFAFGDKVG